MMSFLAKFKKKSGATTGTSKPSASPTPPQDTPITPTTPEKEKTPDPPTPTHAVEIDSIFTGLKLSAQVASKEGDESPYLQRGAPSEDTIPDGSSPFTFLKQEPPPEDGPETTKSPFGFITTQDSPEEEKSGFSFLQPQSHDPEQELHNTKETSHDSEPQSHDPTPKIIAEPEIKPYSEENSVHEVKQVSKQAPRQLTPSSGVKKKKKKRAIRPGQGSKEEPPDVDTISLSSHASSIDSSRNEETLPSPIESTNQDSLDQSVGQLIEVGSTDDVTVETEAEKSEKNEGASDEKVVTETVDGPSEETASTKLEEAETKESELAEDLPTPTEETVTEPPKECLSEELAEVFSKPNYSLELSSSDKLTMLLEGFESGLARIRVSQSVEEVRTTVHEALSSTRGQVEKRKLVAELRTQQAQALAEEDYELAEQVNQRLEETKLTQEHQIVASALKAVSQWLKKCCESDENEIDFRGEMQSKISDLQDEQTKELAQLDKEHSSLIAKDKMKLQSMEDTLEREKGHIALDREHLERREQVLNDEVHRRAEEFISKKESLEEELTSVQDEISSLEDKLKTLNTQRKSIMSSISEQEGKIATVEEELAAEKSQLAEEKEAIVVKEQGLATQQEKLVEERLSLESAHGKLSTSREGVASLVSRAQTVTEEFEKKVDGLKKARVDANGLLKMEQQGRTLLAPSEELTRQLSRVADKSSEVDSMTSKVLSTQTELSAYRKTLSDLEAQVPQLNDAKKAAVAGRQFKEASRIAKELKDITTEIEKVKGQISTAETSLAQLNKELTQQSEELESIKNEADVQEKEEDKGHLTALLTSLNQLLEVKGRLDSSSLFEVVSEWVTLYRLLADNLAVKHSWNLDDYKPADSSSEQLVEERSNEPDVCLEEERTPGVGQEEEATPNGSAEEIAALEKQIEEACEMEDYDKAAELEEQLNQLKTSTSK